MRPHLQRLRRALITPMALASVVVMGSVGIGAYWYLTHVPWSSGITGCSSIRNLEDRGDCYERRINHDVKRRGLEPTLARVDTAAARDVPLRLGCHMALHRTGEQHGRHDAARRQQLAVTAHPGRCSSGYVHGYYIGYFGATSISDPTQAGSTRVAQTCGARGADPLSVVQCVHSFGHAFQRMFTASQKLAATACLSVPDRIKAILAVTDYVTECLQGMFMEEALQARASGRHSLPNPCVKYDDQTVLRACYAFRPVAVGIVDEDWSKAAEACSDAPNADLRRICVDRFASGAERTSQCSLFAGAADERGCRDARARERAAMQEMNDDTNGDMHEGEG